ncbi:MAG: hypothetical protein JW719_14530 [Pirellulales bacterium]|nr:hypothetical protein [Pirellulales bacterium]
MKTAICTFLTLGLAFLVFLVGSSSFAGVLVAWGASKGDPVLNVPTGNDFVAVTGGVTGAGCYGMALRSNGSLAVWGDIGTVLNTPTGSNFVGISTHGMEWWPVALTDEGEVLAWCTDFGPETWGCGPYSTIAGSVSFVFALTNDGAIDAIPAFGIPTPAPEGMPVGGGFTAIAAGDDFGLALAADGSISAWAYDISLGYDPFGLVRDAPTGTGFTKISANGENALALRSDGSIVAWGDNSFGQVSNIPTGTGFTAIAAGSYTVALSSDGTMVSSRNLPAGSGYTDIKTVPYFSLGFAIRSTTPLVDAGEDDLAYVDGPATGPAGEQTVASTIIGAGGVLSMPASGTLNAIDGITIDNGGTLDGGGTLNGNVTNNGTIDSTDAVFNGDMVNNGVVYSSGGVMSGNIVNYGTIYCSGGVFLSGTFINYGSIFSIGPGNGGGNGTFLNYGTLSCFGDEVLPTMDNQGILDPGDGPSAIEFDGDFSQTDGTLMAEIGGYVQGEQYDFIHVTGSASLEGCIDVSFVNGFSPNPGDSFTILTADEGIEVGDAGLSIIGDGNFSWQIVDGTSLQVVSVPEPGFLGWLTIASVFFACLRLARKKGCS